MMGICQLLSVIFLLVTVDVFECKDCYEEDKLRNIQADHVYHKLKHPCVIGHMGNIQEFQENTMEGIKSLIEIKADGAHMHVQLTEDDRLVLFQDDSLYRMTGEDFQVSDLPYSEILKMNILAKIPYYKTPNSYNDVLKHYEYRSVLKVPLLSDVLEVLKGKNMLVYIELMPNKISANPLDRFLALRTAELTAKLIKDFKMENQVLIVSRDATKLAGVNFNHPDISFGWRADTSLYEPSVAEIMKKKFHDFPRVHRLQKDCLNKTGSTGFSFTKYLVSSGFLSKVLNSSFIDFTIDIYERSNYYGTIGTSSLKDTIRTNYGAEATIGAFDIFSWNDTKQPSPDDDRKFIKSVRNFGVTRILTNDVNRVKRALDEEITFSTGNTIKSYFSIIIMSLLFGKTLVTLIYI